MKRLFLSVAILVSVLAFAADPFEESSLKLKVTPPEGYTKLDNAPGDIDFLGSIKAIYISPDVAENRGVLIVHHMSLPGDSADFKAFKENLSTGLGSYFGEKYKKVKQEDIKDPKEGFFIEYTCMGNDQGPSPDGTIPLHMRWYLVKDTSDKMIGFIYGSHADKWEKLEPKISESFKSAKIGK